MNGYLADTNAISEYATPNPDLRVMLWFEQADPDTLFASAIPLGELSLVPELGKLTKKQFENWELLGRGTAINFPDINAALPIDGITEGLYGMRRWMSEASSKGGSAKITARRRASRANGKKGGRPRKVVRA